MAGKMIDELKLVALDEEDLTVFSAHLQDAVMLVGDIEYLPSERRFVTVLNRFVWNNGKPERGRLANERRRTGLHFDRVEKVQSQNIKREQADAVLNLLAIQFLPDNAPAGTIDLIFSGGGVLRLFVECIEAQLSDLGGAWEASSRPSHNIDDD